MSLDRSGSLRRAFTSASISRICLYAITRKLPDPHAGSNTRIRAIRLRRFKSFRLFSPASSSLDRRSSKKSGLSTLRMLGTLV